jgi:RNA ligase (TIGR02306 family)
MPDIFKRFENEMARYQATEKRNLVRFTHIRELSDCAGLPSKQRAVIDGRWLLVVPRNRFYAGQLVVFAEIDSFLPSAVFPDLPNPTTYKGIKGVCLRSVLVGLEVSQGMVFAIESLPAVLELVKAIGWTWGSWGAFEVCYFDFWLAGYLGVLKYESSPLPSPGVREAFLGDRLPVFVPQTGFARLQDCPNLFTKSKYKSIQYQETLKLDGASMSVYFVRRDSPMYNSSNPPPLLPTSNQKHENGRFGVCSHKRELNEQVGCKYWAQARYHCLPETLGKLERNLVVQGELVGATVRDNELGYPPNQHDFFVFDVYDIDKRSYYLPQQTVQLAEALGLRHVPVQGYVNIQRIAKAHQDLLDRADATGSEGLVFKCGNKGGRRGFKVISNQWLLRHGE